MLVKPHELFERALKGNYAVGAFNTSNLEVTQAIAAAGEAQKAAVFIQTSEGAIEYAGLKTLSNIIKNIAEEAEYPIVLHLDHGKSFGMVQACIEAGYASVMIDLSDKSFQENVKATREVVAYAHDRGVWVEAEIGVLKGTLTKPGEVKQFYEETNVDALAVAVGTMHGAFTGQEYIRFELLEEIEKQLPQVPLVLHGASGISDKHLKQAAKTNVCKVNVDTELRLAFGEAVRAYLENLEGNFNPRDMLTHAREAVQHVAESKIQLLGSANQGTL